MMRSPLRRQRAAQIASGATALAARRAARSAGGHRGTGEHEGGRQPGGPRLGPAAEHGSTRPAASM